MTRDSNNETQSEETTSRNSPVDEDVAGDMDHMERISAVCELFTKGKTVKEINAFLREQNVFGGKDLSEEFPDLGQCALYCVTEIHTKSHIDRLLKALS